MTRDGLSTYSVASAAQPDQVRPTWPDGVLFHGSRLLLLLAVTSVVTALFLPMPRRERRCFLMQVIVAVIPATYPWFKMT